VLSDQQKRAKYDRFGHSMPGGAGGGFGGFDFGGGIDISEALRQFMEEGFGFGDIFGAGTRSRRGGGSRRGSDLQVRLKLTLEEIASGVTKKIKVKKQVACEECRGTGSAKNSRTVSCPACHGSGEIRQVSHSIFGQMVNVTTCSRCQGRGQIIENPCAACHGEGRVSGSKTIDVNVPAGVTSGNYIPISGEGNVGLHGSPPGDLIVYIDEAPHEIFKRHEDDVYMLLPISFPQAALGASVEIQTLTGRAKLTIPAGTQSGKILRLRGKGIPHLRGAGMGDQLVQVQVYVPTKLTASERAALEELAKSENLDPQKEDQKTVFERFREALNI